MLCWLLTAMAQCLARGRGPAFAVLICRHLYSSALLVSSSNRSSRAWALPVCAEQSYVRDGRCRARNQARPRTVQAPSATEQVELAATCSQGVPRPGTGATSSDHRLLPGHGLHSSSGDQSVCD
jgi:hypothetical protein